MPDPDAMQDKLSEALARIADLEKQNERLRERAMSLELERHRLSVSSSLDSSTGLKNEASLKQNLAGLLALLADIGGSIALIVFGLDQAEDIERRFGDAVRDEVLCRAGALFRSQLPRGALIFRVGDDSIAAILPEHEEAAAAAIAERVLAELDRTKIFEESVSAIAAVDALAEWAANISDFERTADVLLDDLKDRIKAKRSEGSGRIALPRTDSGAVEEFPLAYVVEPDAFNASVLVELLKRNDIDCEWFPDGVAALERMRIRRPALVISELSVPRLGGLDLRRAMREEGLIAAFRDIPFILLSERKDDATIRTAGELGIRHYLRKPYYLSEVLSLARASVQASRSVKPGTHP